MIKLPVHVGKAYKDDVRDADNECVLFLVGPDRESDAKQIADALNAYEANQALIEQLVDALASAKAAIWAINGSVHSPSFEALNAAKSAGFKS